MSGLKEEDCSNVSICKRSKHIEDEGVDKISSLPDNLLVSILNLLYIKDAAATSVLSRRWRHLIIGICWVKSLILKHWDGPLLCFLSELDSIGTSTFHDLFSLEIERNGNDQNDWKQVPRFPRCLLANLKRLEIKNLMGTNLEIEMLQHILSNTPVLEHLYVSVDSYYENHDSYENVDQLRKEYTFCRKLFVFPKSSESCEIEFSGIAIKTSSKDFINGVLNCQFIDHVHSDCDSDWD